MECLLECTPNFPKNTYVVSGDKLVGFKAFNSTEWKTYRGMSFSKSGRKFQKLSIPKQFETVESGVTVVIGSKGEKYFLKDGKCSCPGFVFRRKCKHVMSK